jgi:hypothetical protein
MFVYPLQLLTTRDLVKELQLLNCDPQGIAILKNKLSHYSIKLQPLSGHIGLILKETALSWCRFCTTQKYYHPSSSCYLCWLLLINKNQLIVMLKKLKRQSFKQIQN